METVRYVNIFLELLGCCLSLFTIFLMKFGNSIKNDLHHKFIWLLVCNMLILLSDAVAWAARGHTDSISYILVRVSNFCVYAFGYIILLLFANYLRAFIATKRPISTHYQYLIGGIVAVALILTVVSQFNGMYYIIDEQNRYHRQGWFWLSQFLGILCMMIKLWVLLNCRKSLSKRELMVFVSYILLPIVAMSIQIFLYGIALLYIATTVSLIVIYIGIQADQVRRINETELELAQNRITIMLSQIQPHFLYNSLTAIKQLCRTNPPLAETAIVNFASYLRSNLDSLSTEKPILFARELSHVETYLELEKMRFGDDLQIVYDIGPSDFTLPVLTVQPLVENAVRYGITKKESGGTVTISTRETKTAIIISVTDDGVGFDPTAEKNDGQQHIGIENVYRRLVAQCGGRLVVNSAVGVGTTAMITLPKGG